MQKPPAKRFSEFFYIPSYTQIRALDVREITFNIRNIDFLSGLQNGLTVTNDVFDTPVVQMPQKGHLGLELDVKALRSDVRKAKAKFTQQTPTAAG